MNNIPTIVQIDSGVTITPNRYFEDGIKGIQLIFDENLKLIEASDDFVDDIGHGTGICGIIKQHNINAEIFVIKICSKKIHIHVLNN